MEMHKHPIRFLSDVIEVRGDGLVFSFSKYFYRPGNVFDERETFEVVGSEINEQWLDAQLASLREGWELALNSKVVDTRNRTHHIGMIDFAPGVTLEEIRIQTKRLLGDEMWASMSCYNSGRSFHGYFNCLLRPGQWHEFLGRLLLMNHVDRQQVVDVRWVGHRLMGGYCALRWSRNTRWHKSYPYRVLYSPVAAAASRARF